MSKRKTGKRTVPKPKAPPKPKAVNAIYRKELEDDLATCDDSLSKLVGMIADGEQKMEQMNAQRTGITSTRGYIAEKLQKLQKLQQAPAPPPKLEPVPPPEEPEPEGDEPENAKDDKTPDPAPASAS
jgi:hypothetical protein